MVNPAFILLVSLFIGSGIAGCDVYDAAVKDTAQMKTEATSSADTIVVTPTGSSFSQDTMGVVFTAAGSTGSFTFDISGQTGSFDGVSETSSTATTLTVDIVRPTSLEGPQTIKITAVDTNGLTGSTTFTLTPAT